jgi:hypothetical protein
MKSNKFKTIFVLSIILVVGGACTENWDELNTDPGIISAAQARPEMILTSILKNAIYSVPNGSGTMGIVSDMGGHTSRHNAGDILLLVDYSGLNYSSRPIEAAELIRLTDPEKQPLRNNQHQIGRIIKVWLMHRYTDQWGDVPYSEALKPVDQVIKTPKYDTQESIYRDMLNELKEAEAALQVDPTQLSFGGADILFKGDVDKWKRFANSLRLRLAMRVRYADATLSQQHISDVVTKPLIETNAQNAQLATFAEASANADNRSPIHIYLLITVNRLYFPLTLSENLKSRNDPRLPIYAKPAEKKAPGDDGYRGRPLQINEPEKVRYHADSIAQFGTAFTQPVLNIKVFTAAEVRFLRAEAALVGFAPGNAQTLFHEGIRLAMQEYNIPAATIDANIALPANTLDGRGLTDEQKLEEIIVQKYLALFMQSDETWAEHRRTGYPRIWLGSELGATEGRLLRRFTYPQLEYQVNENSVKEAASRMQGGDGLLSRVWWDKKPGLLERNGPYAHPRQGLFPPDPM